MSAGTGKRYTKEMNKPTPAEPAVFLANPDIVSLLDDWLVLAKRGRFKAVSVASIYVDGGVRTADAGSCTVCEMAGLLAQSLFEYQNHLVSTPAPPVEKDE